MGGQKPLSEYLPPTLKPNPDPKDYGWEPMCTAKGMETYIKRCSNFNYVLGNISPKYQPIWIRLWYRFNYVWLWGTNQKGCKKKWLGPKLTDKILNALHNEM